MVVVADGKGGGHIQTRVVDMGDVGLTSGKWHALIISHKRSSALLFNSDQLEVSGCVVRVDPCMRLIAQRELYGVS